MAALLKVEELSVGFDTEGGFANVVDRVSFDLEAGETLGLVGESGCGKSVTALSIMGLLPKPAGRIHGGDILFKDQSLPGIPPERMRAIRGNRIAMIFQEPMTALNPVQRIGNQLAETFSLHEPGLPAGTVTRRSLGLLEQVGIPAPERRLLEYPHELSGGMRQRVMIAMALASRPDILIADEPTTALDVTIQAQILELLRQLQQDTGMAILFITHDLGVIAELCSRVVVMYAGRIAEQAPIGPLFTHPLHPYTRGLLASIPRLDDEPKTLLTTIPGTVPSIDELPSGCRFVNRCPFAVERCHGQPPAIDVPAPGRKVSCHRWREVDASSAEAHAL